MERSGVADLFAPPVEEEIGDGEKHGEEKAVGEVERQCERIGGFGVGLVVAVEFEIFAGGEGRGNAFGISPAKVHGWSFGLQTSKLLKAYAQRMRKEGG